MLPNAGRSSDADHVSAAGKRKFTKIPAFNHRHIINPPLGSDVVDSEYPIGLPMLIER